MAKKDIDKNWMKLDNAAIIYPTTLSRNYAVMFRTSVTFTENIDPIILEAALKNVLPRFPSFSYRLSEGLFWFYLKKIDGFPTIEEDYKNPMYGIDFKKTNHFLFRIRYFETRLAIEYFHALTDGYGGLTFLLTLTHEYIRLKYNEKIVYSNMVLNPCEEPKEEEYNDMFKKFARKIGKPYKENKAYHYYGKNVENHMLKIITGKVDLDKLKEKCKEYSCTITDFIVSVMIYSLQEIQKKEIEKQKNRKEIKVTIPIDLRRIYKVNSLRNFSSYENPGINPKLGEYSFEEIVNEIHNQMKLAQTEKRLNSKISSNINLEDNPFIKRVPLFIKRHVISFIQNRLGDNYITATCSNLGYVKLEDNIEKYITEMNFILGKAKNNSGRTSCIGYKDKVFISFSRKIEETEFERLFFCKLVEFGIPVTIESNEGD